MIRSKMDPTTFYFIVELSQNDSVLFNRKNLLMVVTHKCISQRSNNDHHQNFGNAAATIQKFLEKRSDFGLCDEAGHTCPLRENISFTLLTNFLSCLCCYTCRYRSIPGSSRNITQIVKQINVFIPLPCVSTQTLVFSPSLSLHRLPNVSPIHQACKFQLNRKWISTTRKLIFIRLKIEREKMLSHIKCKSRGGNIKRSSIFAVALARPTAPIDFPVLIFMTEL